MLAPCEMRRAFSAHSCASCHPSLNACWCYPTEAVFFHDVGAYWLSPGGALGSAPLIRVAAQLKRRATHQLAPALPLGSHAGVYGRAITWSGG